MGGQRAARVARPRRERVRGHDLRAPYGALPAQGRQPQRAVVGIQGWRGRGPQPAQASRAGCCGRAGLLQSSGVEGSWNA